MDVSLTVNGIARTIEADADRSLLYLLRNDLGLRASHFGCGVGECGACMVMLDGRAVPACDTPLWSVAGKSVETSESLGTRAAPHALQTAFIAEQAVQCGYCTSGLLVSAAALLRQDADPDEATIRAAMARNLCRCGTHPRVVRAIARAAAQLRA